MATGEHTFKVGNRVKFKKKFTENPTFVVSYAKLGDGPYVVLKIIPVPKDQVDSVGHRQWLVFDGTDGQKHQFSGTYFELV
jgi:hypothetical protein